MRRPSRWETSYGYNKGSSAQETLGARGRARSGGRDGMGWEGRRGREEGAGGPGTRPPGASFLLAAAFKEAPGLRWSGRRAGRARPAPPAASLSGPPPWPGQRVPGGVVMRPLFL